MTRSEEKELMDDPLAPRELRQGELENLRAFNRYLGGRRCAVKDLRRLIRRHRLTEFSLLDVGTGSADIVSAIALWARSKKLKARITAIDCDPVAIEIAADRVRPLDEIAVARADAAAPPFRPRSFDFVLASQFLHHFSEEETVELLRTWSKLARRAIIVSDLLRHSLAYHGVRLITRLCTRNLMTLTDAPLSVARAFTLAEWRGLFRRAAIGDFQVCPVFPFRVSGTVEVLR